jgi:ribonucleotide monophosphatase NagD (HAD superfamily)
MVLEAFPDAGPRWMIGDSLRADVRGAEAVGIPAVLVRRYHVDAERCVETLGELLGII